MGKKKFEAVLIDERFRRLVSDQSGLVSAKQLHAFGLNRTDVCRARKARRLKRVLPGVFQVTACEDRWRQRLQGAVLWLPRAVISHRAALRLHKIDGVSAAAAEVTADTPTVGQWGIKVHFTRRVVAEERTTVQGFPVTSLSRTLFDLSPKLNPDNLAYAVECAWRKKLVFPAALLQKLRAERDRGIAGLDRLEEVLQDCITRRRPFDSALEVRMWRLLKREAILLPQLQYEFRDEFGELRIDFVFPDQGIALETRGAEPHSGKEAFEYDSSRTARLTARGWTVMPITWRMLETDTPRVVRQLRQALDRRSRSSMSADWRSPDGPLANPEQLNLLHPG